MILLKRLALMLTIALSMFAFTSPANAATFEVVTNNDFASLTSWTAAPSTADSVAGTCGYNGVTAPGTETLTSTAGFPALGASTTTALGSVSQTAIGFRSCVLYQDVAIPAGATTAVLTIDTGIKLVGGLASGDTAIFAGIYSTASVPSFNASASLAGTIRLIIGGATAGVVLTPQTSVTWNVSSLAGTTVRLAIINAMQSTASGTGAFIPGAGSVIGLGRASLTVTVPAPVVVSPTSLPAGTPGTGYSQTFTATGGNGAPYAYTVFAGALPPGLSLNGVTGVLSGTPSTAGTSTFTIKATDTGAAFNGTQAYTFTVAGEVPPIPVFPAMEISGVQAVSESGSSVAVSFTLKAGPPMANAVVPIVSTNTNEVAASASSITFTPGGSLVQTVTFTGVDDSVIDGDQAVLIQVGAVQSTDVTYANYKPADFYIVNRDNDMALPSLPFAGGSQTGYLDIANTSSTVISSIAAKVYDTLGVVKGNGSIAQNVPGKGNVSVSMQTLQTALGISGVASSDYARIELFPVGGDILAQSRIKDGNDTYNVSALSRGGSPGMQSTTSPDGFKLRITNLSNQAQEGRATVYNGDGVTLGQENGLLFSALPSNATVELNAATLQGLLNVAPWSSRAWLKMSNPDVFGLQLLNTSSGVRTLTTQKYSGLMKSLDYIQPAGDPNVVSMIRIYNNQGYAAAFTGFLYDSNGALLAVVSLGTVPAHGVLLITNSQLQGMSGVPVWSGAARIKITSEASSYFVQGSLRNQGYLTDTTSVISDGMVAHLPDGTEGLDIDLNIVNPGAETTTLTGTLTNSAGQTIGTANFAVGALAKDASMRLSRASLEALAGTWSGRATLTLSSSVGNVDVLALLRNTTTGALTNLSERPLRQ